MNRLKNWIIRVLGGFTPAEYQSLTEELQREKTNIDKMVGLALCSGYGRRVQVIKTLDKEQDFPGMMDVMQQALMQAIMDQTSAVKIRKVSHMSYVAYEAKIWVYEEKGNGKGT